jgi:hypothetical protein
MLGGDGDKRRKMFGGTHVRRVKEEEETTKKRPTKIKCFAASACCSFAASSSVYVSFCLFVPTPGYSYF